jgi:hypothetical protein
VIDLGGAFQCEINKSLLEKIPGGVFLKTTSGWNYQGLEIPAEQFLYKKIKFLKAEISNFILSTMPDNEMDFSLIKGKPNSVPWDETIPSSLIGRPDGYIGHHLLQWVNVLLNFQTNEFIAYSLDKTPLFKFPYGCKGCFNAVSFDYTDRKWLTCTIQTSFGPKRFVIDTGATITLLKPTPELTQSSTQLTPDHLPSVHTTEFRLGKTNYGTRDIHLKEDFTFEGIDGVLGMDFFHNKILFFDMKNHILYLKD